MDDYIDVKIDVFAYTAQRARLRKTLTAGDLIDEILKEFKDDVPPDKYALYLKGADRPLNPNLTLEQLDIQPQDELDFHSVRQAIRQMLNPKNYATMQDDSTGRGYEIQWQPAIIGRPTNEADHNINLAVNLLLHPKGQTVSRKHAQITFSDGRFMIEPLAERNPVAINGKEIPFGVRKEIKNGDRILIGRSDLLMTFVTRPALAPEPHSRPLASPPPPIANRPTPIATRPEPDVLPANPEAATFILPPNAPAPARLVVERATDMSKAGQRLELVAYPYVISRELPLFSGENEISRRHAAINFDPVTKKYVLADLNSTNGVTIQGTRIEPNRPYEITSGMRLGFGHNVTLRFEI